MVRYWTVKCCQENGLICWHYARCFSVPIFLKILPADFRLRPIYSVRDINTYAGLYVSVFMLNYQMKVCKRQHLGGYYQNFVYLYTLVSVAYHLNLLIKFTVNNWQEGA